MADLYGWSLGVLGLPLWSIVLAVGVVALSAVKRNGGKSSNLPPGPPPLPVLGNLHLFATSRPLHRELAKLAAKYGDIVWVKLGSKGAIVVSSPAMAREILKNQDAVFAFRSKTFAMAQLTFDNISFAPYGPALLQSKKVMASELMSGKRLKQFEGVRSQEIAAVVATIRSHVTKAGSGAGRPSPVNVTLLLNLLNLNSVTRMGISKKFFDYHIQEDTGKQSTSDANKDIWDAETFLSLMKELIAVIATQLFRDCIPYLSIFDNLNPVKYRIQRIRKRMDQFLTTVIEEHRNESRKGSDRSAEDYLDALLQLNEQGELSNDSVKGQVIVSPHLPATVTCVVECRKNSCMLAGLATLTLDLKDMILAGTDTTASTTEWAMAELLRHPATLERAEKEVNSVVSRDRQVTEADLPKLPYLGAIVKETLRLHPVVPLLVPHCSVEDTKVAGYDIPAQTVVFVNAWAISTDPGVWKDPLQFIPERFIDRPDVDIRGQSFEVLPFGSGRRGCAGTNLGLSMAHLTLATLLHNFLWSLPDNVKQPQDLDMTEKKGLGMSRVEPLQVLFSLRHG